MELVWQVWSIIIYNCSTCEYSTLKCRPNFSLTILAPAKSRWHVKLDETVRGKWHTIFKLFQLVLVLFLRIVITEKFPMRLCYPGCYCIGAQGELSLDYKFNHWIKDCTVQGRMKTLLPYGGICSPHSLNSESEQEQC